MKQNCDLPFTSFTEGKRDRRPSPTLILGKESPPFKNPGAQKTFSMGKLEINLPIAQPTATKKYCLS